MTIPPSAPTASRTAERVAALRAAHPLLDRPPYLLDDPVAIALLDPAAVSLLRSTPERLETPGARTLRSHVLLRSRVAEDRLREATARGVRQYVVLGAGFDTFAYRQPEWAHALTITEIDQPATQSVKLARLASAAIAVPTNVVHGAIDFEREPLADGLRRIGVRTDEPIFFAWLGVIMYLTDAAVGATFRAIAALPAGSEVVFTFALPATDVARFDGTETLSASAAALGEPWLSFHEPETLGPRLTRMGFSDVEFFSPDALAKYYEERTDELPRPKRVSIGAARV